MPGSQQITPFVPGHGLVCREDRLRAYVVH